MVIVRNNSLLKKILPLLSLFVTLLCICLVFNVLRDINPNLIPYRINKILNLFILPIALIIELTKTRERLWKSWKKIPIAIHFIVTLFFSGIILKIFPLAWVKIWNEED